MSFTIKNIPTFFLILSFVLVVYAQYHLTVINDSQLCKWFFTKNEHCSEQVKYTAFVDVAFDVINLMVN